MASPKNCLAFSDIFDVLVSYELLVGGMGLRHVNECRANDGGAMDQQC
jgi:hypothetical protein